jgi:hypothetical protein
MNSQKKQLLQWSYWFSFGNAILLWLIGIHYLFFISPFSAAIRLPFASKFFIILFIALVYIGYFAFCAFIPCILLLPIILLLPKRSVIFPLAIGISSIIAIYFIIDSVIFALFRFHMGGVVWQMILSGDSKQIFELSWLEYCLAFVIIGGVITLECFYAWRLWRKIDLNKKFLTTRWWTVFFIACLFFSYCMLIFSAGQFMFRLYYLSARFLPYYNNVLGAIFLPKNNPLGLEVFGMIYLEQPKQAQQKLHYPIKPLVCQTQKNKLNLVIIVIDTWRFDMLNSEVTPSIYRFAKHATQYTKHFSGGDATQPGIFSLFYGIPATYWTAMKDQGVGPVLIDELLKQHYQMGIFGSAALTEPAFNKTIFVNTKNIPLETPGNNAAERDTYITHEFKTFVTGAITKPDPFFSFIFYDSAHGFCSIPNDLQPFQPVVRVCNRLELNTKTNPTPYFNRYKNALLSVDTQINQVLDTLRNQHLLANTVVLITGDHGEEFNDTREGYWGHSSNFTYYQTQTPLVVYWPGQNSKEINYLTSHFDIAPTLLTQMLGCQNPPNDYSVGHLLSNPVLRPYLIISSYIDFGIVEPDRITTIYPDGNFDISNLEGKPLIGAHLRLKVMRSVFKDLRRFY